jgi:hypothetical protein
VSLLQHIRVIVRELLAGSDVANGVDPDATVIDYRIAVRIARMIDEPRFVSIESGVDYDIVIDCKEIRMMPLLCTVGISLIRFSRRQALSRILDDSGAGCDRAGGESAEPLYRRITHFERNFRKNDYRCILQFLIPGRA